MSILLTRYLSHIIRQDLDKKMVFLGGPRQVGKTTLAQSLIPNYMDGHLCYLNWDSDLDRKKIKNHQWPSDEKIIILDEIHKYKNWRTFVKGLYDTLKNTHSFMVTGSARLDHLRKGGDSLLGRYYYYRLHPYSLPEIMSSPVSHEISLSDLFLFGGFPEPLLSKDLRTLKRWHIERLSKLIRVDLRDLDTVSDLDKMELLAEELPRRVASPLSMKSLAEDLEINPKTVKRWISLLDSLYYSFQIAPYGAPKIRAVKKEQKLYLWDWSQVEDEGPRFENMTASLLLKFCHYHTDVNGEKMELRYIRDTDKREIDFVVMKNKKPLFAVECKLKDQTISPQLYYFKERTNIPVIYQISLEGKESQPKEGIIKTSFERLCVLEKLV